MLFRQFLKIILIWFLIIPGSCAGLFSISWFIADPLVNRPFDPGASKEIPVLLIWPDRIEIKRIEKIEEISPRSAETPYRFLIPPERKAWIRKQVIQYPPPNPNADASWNIRVKNLDNGHQKIQLELFGDGIVGLVYEASETEIRPLYRRITGPGFSLIVGFIHLILWVIVGLVTYVIEQKRKLRGVCN